MGEGDSKVFYLVGSEDLLVVYGDVNVSRIESWVKGHVWVLE